MHGIARPRKGCYSKQLESRVKALPFTATGPSELLICWRALLKVCILRGENDASAGPKKNKCAIQYANGEEPR
jgi:hypothetical protein